MTYVVAHWNEYRHNLLDIISPIQSDGTIGIQGMVLLGGVIAAIVIGGWFVKRRKVSFWAMADVSAPPLALGIGIGRIGCFLNGCCFGYPTEGFLGIVFPQGCYASSIYPNIHIHPTQAYSAIAAFLIAILLPMLEKRWRLFAGWTFSIFMILYGIDRLIVEGFRFYDSSKYFELFGTQWTGSRIVALAMIAFGIVSFLLLPRKQPVAAKSPQPEKQNTNESSNK